MAKKTSKPQTARAKDLLSLPQDEAKVWQADICKAPAWLNIAGKMLRPWMVLVTNRTDDLVLAHDMLDNEPSPKTLSDALARAMRSPAAGKPHRPGVVHFRSETLRAGARSSLQSAGIESIVQPELDQLDFVLNELGKHLQGGQGIPSLQDAPGIRPEQVRSYFEAAASFFRRSPWDDVPGDTPIRVECSLASSPWCAIVMGQSREVFGLALYESYKDLARVLQSDSPEEETRSISGLSLMYSECHEISVRDLDAAEKHGWPVAGPTAYPFAVRVNPGRSLRAPLVWELEFLTACLWTLPDFLALRSKPALQTPAASGGIEMSLAWIDPV